MRTFDPRETIFGSVNRDCHRGSLYTQSKSSSPLNVPPVRKGLKTTPETHKVDGTGSGVEERLSLEDRRNCLFLSPYQWTLKLQFTNLTLVPKYPTIGFWIIEIPKGTTTLTVSYVTWPPQHMNKNSGQPKRDRLDQCDIRVRQSLMSKRRYTFIHLFVYEGRTKRKVK